MWHAPWTEVRYGTEHEQGDIEFNENLANALLFNDLDLLAAIIAATPDDKRFAQGFAIHRRRTRRF
jgi:hypothetical protein